ncbi:MAG: biosynthetic arginine decarboxylase [Planctomycetota bacterium]|nr:biosynthetic arginine decarboxylase [Planctomycetota bacterium]
MMSQIIDDNAELYGIENWGAGYFHINRSGHLTVKPLDGDLREVDLFEVVRDLVDKHRLTTPILLRFPQILGAQVMRLCRAYEAAASECSYTGDHFPVFPIKVNPRREVLTEFIRTGARQNVGLECGSKAELQAALSLEQPPDSLLVCNGFKDEAFLRLAMMGVRAGKRVVVVLEKLNELRMVIRLSEETGIVPLIGLRAKLYSRGSGKWEASGGEAAKFGLTTSEMLECVRMLDEVGLRNSIKLLHFHIGSQITNIKRVKNAMKEAARVYARFRQLKVDIEYLDIGGGLGVDYDGSKTTSEGSINYTIEEFANNVVYAIQSVCDEDNVPHPHIVTESGRVMTAHHAVCVTSVRDEIETFADDTPAVEVDEDDPHVISELKSLLDLINAKNYREYYHDALDDKDDLHTQFNLGLISLEDRAKGEVLFWDICERSSRFASEADLADPEFERLRRSLASKYLCNLSLFRSAPDSWAIGQLFPIMPIHRLNETPTEFTTLVDITCDSDGCVKRFVDQKDVRTALALHKLNKEPYYVAMFLVGAYQEVMGSYHNLFGQTAEAHVVVDADGSCHVTRLHPGSCVEDMLTFARFEPQQCIAGFQRMLDEQVTAGHIDAEAAQEAVDLYTAATKRGTYLE